MIKLPFREHHLLTLLNDYGAQNLPLDLFVSHYFRAHKALGSKDKAFIAEMTYSMVRWQGLLDHICSKPGDWTSRFEAFRTADLRALQADESIPVHTRVSFPEALFDLFINTHGKEKAIDLCLISNTQAPTTVRANTLKISRDDLLARWDGLYDVVPCERAPDGILFKEKMNFFTLPEFKQGLFEVQDEGSQLLASLVQPQPKQLVMDFCAGSGGKTLAFAPSMKNQGQIFLHDVRKHALIECRKRMKRAGIQNAQQVASDEAARLKKLKKKMDWVLVDAPCSGTGTFRRNPDMKWRFDKEALQRLVGQQRTIFEKALSYLKPDGRIVYGTCSLLKEENEEQVEHFLKTYNLEVEGEVLKTLPSQGGMDGFFGVVFKVRSSGVS